ncbi:SulP family inorganic anion transporter [Flavobacterium cheniae]|uniref:MFS superfamily sulfate permease-like transporter n=1 Tax=Flavobacterium cheniae TaxID=295428 RepID=A0A562KJL1_9FLAO|nr:SulP family inorganic anion transporter [Flavobacterium cheniae]TDR25954.1 MFS superfamily sulfate permease-like transporter [Flavobacterium cheniae]TWH95561.1 MFS superfamily sulfate permease-like transporter [Flavobacterium cheniae]
MNNHSIFSNVRGDLASGLVVFLVALPLCLGIALASGAPLFSGIVSGVIGGVVVGFLSNSALSVTGPAAGLTAIVLAAITDLGGFDIFLVAVILAGLIQIALGFLRAGSFSNYFPTSVIEGMLAAIGIIIILKQIPHAFGHDVDNEGDFFYIEKSGHTTFDTLFESINYIHTGALIIALLSLAILITWEKVPALKKIKVVPGALVVVVVSILLNEFFIQSGSSLAIVTQNHLVSLPSFTEISNGFALPNFASLTNEKVWIVAVTIAVVASIETLLCIEATDKLDPYKRFTDTNRELKAQGIGNIVSGLLGGLPMTSVVVRSSANINSGGRTKFSTIFHGLLLFTFALSIPFILNKIPLAALAAVLLMVGYKLAKPSVFVHLWNNGYSQFIPFVVTVIAVVRIDLLKGVGIGLAVSIIFILYQNLKFAYSFKKESLHDGDIITIKLAEEVSFLNKAAIKNTLGRIPKGSKLVIDASNTKYIDFDVVELIKDFRNVKAEDKKIDLTLKGFKEHYNLDNTEFKHIEIKEDKKEIK